MVKLRPWTLMTTRYGPRVSLADLSTTLVGPGALRRTLLSDHGLKRHGPIWALIAPATVSLPLSCRIRSCHPPKPPPP